MAHRGGRGVADERGFLLSPWRDKAKRIKDGGGRPNGGGSKSLGGNVS